MFVLSRARLTLVCAALALIPSLASASGTTRLGHPHMSVFTAKVPGPFDVSGRRVAELARGRFAAGSHPFVWDARDANGIAPRSGIYFVRAAGPGVNVVQRVVRIDGR